MNNNEDLTSTDKFTGTMDVQEKLKFPEKELEEYLSDTIPGFEGNLLVKEFKGGQSNPTYQLITPKKNMYFEESLQVNFCHQLMQLIENIKLSQH